MLLEDIFPEFPSKIGKLLITYSFLLSKLSRFYCWQCFKAKIIFFPLMISFHGLRDSFFFKYNCHRLTNKLAVILLSHNFMIWLQWYARSDWLFSCNEQAVIARFPKHIQSVFNLIVDILTDMYVTVN